MARLKTDLDEFLDWVEGYTPAMFTGIDRRNESPNQQLYMLLQKFSYPLARFNQVVPVRSRIYDDSRDGLPRRQKQAHRFIAGQPSIVMLDDFKAWIVCREWEKPVEQRGKVNAPFPLPPPEPEMDADAIRLFDSDGNPIGGDPLYVQNGLKKSPKKKKRIIVPEADEAVLARIEAELDPDGTAETYGEWGNYA